MRHCKLISVSAAIALAIGSAGAFAHSAPQPVTPHQGSAMQDSTVPVSTIVMGKHDMDATVTSVDHTTGMVEATSEGMQLRLHFPPSALASVNMGDTITLHLSFSKK